MIGQVTNQSPCDIRYCVEQAGKWLVQGRRWKIGAVVLIDCEIVEIVRFGALYEGWSCENVFFMFGAILLWFFSDRLKALILIYSS